MKEIGKEGIVRKEKVRISDLEPKDTLVLESESDECGKFSTSINVDEITFRKGDRAPVITTWKQHPEGEFPTPYSKSLKIQYFFRENVQVGQETNVVIATEDESGRWPTLLTEKVAIVEAIRHLGIKNYQRTPIGL